MGEPSIDSLHDPYEDQLSAARFKAERDAAVQELQAMRERNIELWMESGMANELVTCAEQKAERLGKLVWRLQNRLARSHRRERNLRKGMREWREKVMGAPVRTMSAYDLLPEEDLQTLRWVREQGGLAEVEKRLMPEGYEWPRYESGELLRYKDRYIHDGAEHEVWHVDFDSYGDATILNDDCSKCSLDKGERVKRPAPKVLDADGVEIYKGRIAYGTRGRKYRVTELCEYEPSIVHAQAIDDGELGDEFIAANTGLNSYQLDASKLTHRAPVLAGDGKPLREGETVWHKSGFASGVVESIDAGSLMHTVRYQDESGGEYRDAAKDLTHERPEIDSWEQLEKDAEKDPCGYFGFDGEEICGKCPASGKNCEQTMARDLVRRAKKLAGVDND